MDSVRNWMICIYTQLHSCTFGFLSLCVFVSLDRRESHLFLIHPCSFPRKWRAWMKCRHMIWHRDITSSSRHCYGSSLSTELTKEVEFVEASQTDRQTEKWTRKWASSEGCVIGWLSEWVSEYLSEWMNEWVSERASEWVSEWVNEWVTEWVSKWVSEWVSKWVSVGEWVE